MGSSVFFENAKIFWVPSRLTPADLIMVWLLLTWVVYFDLLLPPSRRSGEQRRLFGPALSLPEELAVVGIIVLALVQVALTTLRYGELAASFTELKGFVYLFAGYFLLRGMLCRAGREDTLAFIKSLVLVNALAAVLFIAHQGLHLPVYIATEYQTITFMGQRITRSFYFMPQLLALAIAYVFARRTWNVLWVGVALVTLGALWVSYTRSLLVIALAELVVVLGVRLVKARQAGIVVRRVATLAAILLVFGIVAYTVLPVQSQYFLSRIGMATSSGSVTGDPNLQNRIDKIKLIASWLSTDEEYVGAGFTSSSQDPNVANMKLMSSDLVWVPVFYRFGLLGVALVVLLYATMGWRATRLSLSGDGDAEFLALILLGVVVGTFLEGFVSWTFLNPARYPMGFWLFAFVAAEACRRRSERAEAPAPSTTVPAEVAHV
jgi:O-antigen ligase